MTERRQWGLAIALALMASQALAQPGADDEDAQSPQAYELVEDDTPAVEAEPGQPQAPVVREFKPTEEVMADTILTLPADI